MSRPGHDEPLWSSSSRSGARWCALVALAACGACSRAPQAAGPIKTVATFGEVGVSAGQFSYPRALDQDGAALWVVDKTARVQKLDPATGTYLGGWKMPESKFGKPTGITMAPGDGGETLAYVPDTHYHRVMVYRPGDAYEGRAEPTLVAEIGSFGEGPGQFIYPTDVAVLIENGAARPSRLYVSEYGGNDRINVFEHDAGANQYTYSFSFGHFGDSASGETIEFKRPQSLQIDMRRRELVLTDACNHRLGRFTLEGKLVGWIGSVDAAVPSDPNKPGAAGGVRFNFPYGLCLLPDGTALVAEFGGGRVQWIDVEAGASLGVFGIAGRGPGQLASPWAVTWLNGRAYVLDSGNNRVQAFELPSRPRHVAMATGGETSR